MGGILLEHLEYLTLPNRLELFKAAIQATMPAGATVLDAGCGTGVLGLSCLQAGASRIYAVDSSAAIELASESFVRAGWGEQAHCIRDSTFRVSLPELVDLVICDHVGFFGFDYGLLDLLADAKSRLLKPGGKLIPGRLKLKASLVESKSCLDKTNAWHHRLVPPEYRWLREYSVNTKAPVTLEPSEVLSYPAELCDLDLTADQPAFFSWTVHVRADRSGIVHGLGGWFECELAANVWMTNSPLSVHSIGRPQAFLPLGNPIAVDIGDVVTINILARPGESMIAWSVGHQASGRTERHSTWLGDPLEREQFSRLKPGHTPVINPQAAARQLVLQLCDGRRTVREIQREVLAQQPELFPSPTEIERFVAQVLYRDTQ